LLKSFGQGSKVQTGIGSYERIEGGTMIQTAMEYLADELEAALNLDDETVTVERLQILQEKKGEGIVFSLLNVEEESTLKNLPHHFIQKKNSPDPSDEQNTLFQQIPPLSLNLRVVFAFDFDDYGTTIQRLSGAANFFHKRRWFSPGNGAEHSLPKPIGKMIVDLETLSLEQLNHVWSISGGVHYPALFYKIRLLKLEQDEPAQDDPVRTIELIKNNYSTAGELKKSLKEKRKEKQENGT
jgi:hypothetical protein